jgi:inhibitor of cysteine peptidase
MKRMLPIVAVLIAAIAAGSLLGCTTDGATAPYAGAEPVVATEKDDGQTLGVAKGQDLVVELPANPSTGYTWIVLALPSVVETVGEPAFESGASESSMVVGAGGTMKLTFRAVEAGTGKLELGYMRPWETAVAPEQTYSLTLNVN